MRIKILLIFCLICTVGAILASEGAAAIYKYLDKDNLICFANDLQSIPEQYRADAKIVSGEQAQSPSLTNQPAVPHSVVTSESVAHEQSLTQQIVRSTYSGRWLLSAIIIVSAVFAFMVLGILDTEHKKTVAIARIVIIWCVTVYLLYAHAGDAVRMVRSANGSIENVQNGSAEKGRKTAEVMKKFNEEMNHLDHELSASQADAEQRK